MKQQISKFEGQYAFLSNFYPAEVEFEGARYPSSEHAYQAAKTLDLELRKPFQDPSVPPGKAKKMGRKLQLREDWEEERIYAMADILYDKFTRHLELLSKLRATGDAELIEGNNWGDRFWGVDGTGQNNLGKLLMEFRDGLR